MKRFNFLNLSNAGCLLITNHDLTPAHAYKVVKFRKALGAALKDIDRDLEGIRKDVGIEDAAAFDKELFELRDRKERTPEEETRLAGMEVKLRRFLDLRGEMLDEEAELDCKALPYEEWHRLQNENRAVEVNGQPRDVLSGYVEDALEGVLWAPPEE